MGLIDFILSLVLLVAGSVVLWQLVKVLFGTIRRALGNQALGSAPSASGRSTTSGSQKKIPKSFSKADKLIEEKQFKKAIKVLRKSINLEKEPTETTLASVKEHHENILSRFLTISEALGVRITNLQQVESLFSEHADLNVQMARAKLSFQKLQEKRGKLGKEIPSWSKEDFNSRKKEIKVERLANIKELKKELEELYKTLANPAPPSQESDITYH